MNPEAGPAIQNDLPGRSYSYDRDQVVDWLGSDPVRGLDAPSVEAMRGRFGANRLPEAKPRSRLLLFLEQFINPLI
jgi:magnesium-transporting ATPase (P-type)